MSEDDSELGSYPSTEAAYELAVKTYPLAIQRADAMDARLQSAMSMASAISFAIPIAARNMGLSFESPWFLAILFLFLVEVAVYFRGRFVVGRGDIEGIDPKRLHQDYLHLPEDEFKRDIIWYAGETWERNNDNLITPRWWHAVTLSFVLVVKVLVFCGWVFWTL